MNDFDLIDNNSERTFGGSLGTNCTEKGTTFRVWQPLAESAELRLYGSGCELIRRAAMRRKNGIFECRVRGDLDGVLYNFAVTRNGETVECGDPYARTVTADGRFSVLVNMRRHTPKGWAGDRPITFGDPEDAVIYELSVRDFSSDENAGFRNRGKLAAFSEGRAVNSYGDRVGLSYIKKLGVTHIQLMPLFDFDMDGGNNTDVAMPATKSQTGRMRPKAGAYNWGYNPRFYNAPSAYYTQTDGVKELRGLVAAAHKKGLGVVADVVYNHVFDVDNSVFQRLFPGYFFRVEPKTGAFSNGSGCGNEFASERVMARKFIVDSLVFLAREYHLDGFRFDLMGLLDIETLREAERRLREINPDILLYGEGWTGGASPLDESRRAVLPNAPELRNFAFFNDRLRDAIKGSVFGAADRGYVNGAPDDWHFEPIRAALSGEFPADFWTSDPRQTINYVECHDNLTLFDKLQVSLDGADLGRIKQADKMAAALVLLSRGTAFLQAGQEFFRTKNGESNSYNLPDSVNSIKWDNVTLNRYIVEYYRGLIALRKRFRRELIECEGRRVFARVGGGFVMTAGELVLIVSPTAEEISPNIGGSFKVFADGERASDKPLYTAERLCCAGYSILFAKRIK